MVFGSMWYVIGLYFFYWGVEVGVFGFILIFVVDFDFGLLYVEWYCEWVGDRKNLLC